MTDRIVLENAFLIDGNGGDPVEDATVVVEGNIIKEILSPGKAGTGAEGRCIDVKGKTLMPGLIDAHVHVGNIEMDMRKTAALPPAVYVHRATRNLETDLALGYTTLRDAGGLDWGFREAINQGLIAGPRVLLSVSMLTQTGGHGDKRSIAQDENQPRNSIGMYPAICDGPDAVRKYARDALRRGADQVKVMADGGVASPTDKPGQWQYEVDELHAAVQVADAAGTYVMAHCYTDPAIRNCLDAGVKSIEHGNLMGSETAVLMAEKGAYLVPTCTTYEVLAEFGKREGIDPFVLEKLKWVTKTGLASLEAAHRTGVKIGFGTDIIGPYQHLKVREFSIRAEVMSPMEIIVSATRTNSELFNMQDRFGTLEPGKLADLIIIDGNPLKDMSIFQDAEKKVVLVMKEGTIFKDLL